MWISRNLNRLTECCTVFFNRWKASNVSAYRTRVCINNHSIYHYGVHCSFARIVIVLSASSESPFRCFLCFRDYSFITRFSRVPHSLFGHLILALKCKSVTWLRATILGVNEIVQHCQRENDFLRKKNSKLLSCSE